MLKKAYFIDADYIVKDNETYVRLYLKGKGPCRRYYKYTPYFYVDAPIEKKDLVLKVRATLKTGEVASVEKVEQITKILGMEKKKLLKIYCRIPGFVPALKAAMPFVCYEYEISFARRFMLDFGLTPFSLLKYEVDGKFIKKIKSQEETEMSLSTLAFDIETYNPKGAPRENIDPTIMISWHGKTRGVATYKKTDRKFAIIKKNEKEVLETFGNVLKEECPDVLLGYNSTNFDLPYLEKRSEILKADLNFGKWPGKIKKISKGMTNGAKLNGRIHIDLYPSARFFGFIGLIKTNQYTLEAVYASITGKEKKMVQRLNIWEIWDSNDIDELADYSMMDADATDVLGKEFLPILKELSIITKMPLFDVSISTSGQLVEQLLMFNATKHDLIIPPKPQGSEIQERMQNPIQGAYVKLPKPGIYENIAVLDFRGLYPSIITSYNISPETVADSEAKDVHVAPDGTRFVKKPKGIIPMVLEEVVEARGKIKKQLKSLGKDSDDYKRLDARQFSLKILANSFYGFSVYPRARWYSRKCGASTTAWGREHIQNTIAEAEKMDIEVLYGDSLPPERKIVVKYPDGQVKIEPIGAFVESHKTNSHLQQFKTLAFDGKKLVFSQINQAISHHYPKDKGELLEFTTTNGRTVVTPQHSIYKYENGIKLANAKELKEGDLLISLTNLPSEEIYKEGHMFDITKLSFGHYHNNIYLYSDNLQFPAKKGVCPYCGKETTLSSHVSYQHTERKIKLENGEKSVFAFLGTKNAKGGKIPRYWTLTKELAWLFGYYAAEGSASEKTNVHQKEMVSFGSQKLETIERVKTILETITSDNLAIIKDFDKRINKNTYYYRVQRSTIVALFVFGFGLGKKSEGKRVPEIILNASEGLRSAFLEGYFEGDGTTWHDARYKTHFQRISTKSSELAIGVHYLFKSLSTRAKNAFGKRIENVHWKYRIDKPGIIDLRFQAVKEKENENFCIAKIKKIRKIEYEGPVYDLEVEGTHNFVDAEGLILVHNTDSVFLIYKHKNEVLEFMEKVNKKLPERMELELEAFYPRGVFVTKKVAGKDVGAKKKYALISEDGRIKIRGFELVRRDWSGIARNTQRKVLEAILKEGSKEKAVEIVQSTIKRLKEGKVKLEELAISTQISKPPSKYEIKSPEISAALKAMEHGAEITKGSIIRYVVTKKGKSISEKAEPLEFAKDYDVDYYINNQLLPAVMKILKELGFDETDLKVGGKQKGLDSFF